MRYTVGLLFLLISCLRLCAQDQPDATDKVLNFPSKFFSSLNKKTADLNNQLNKQTQKYLAKLAKRENKLKERISKMDSTAAKNLFGNSSQEYANLAQKFKTDSGKMATPLSGEYMAGIDSLKGSLSFLQQNKQLLGANPAIQAKLQQSIAQFQQLQAKMQNADAIKAYISGRQGQIKQYLSQYTKLPPGLASQYQGMQQEIYYYSTEVKNFKETLNNPDALAQKALAILAKLPAFQNFMKANGQMGSLFSVPGNYNTAQALQGMQGKDQIAAQIKAQAGKGGADPMALIGQNVSAGQSQLDKFKNKLSALGPGSGDMDMPNFKPQTNKTKTFLKRLEYTTDLQTTSTSYYFPTTTDLGLDVGYMVTNSSTVGIGASYKLGWGNGFQHIAMSSQGASIRSFMDIKIGKAGFSATGGLEYNYQQLISSFQQIRSLSDWSQSGLIGISKSISVKSAVFKKTKVTLLWDFLSYYQNPVTQPFKFRVGYTF